MQVTYPGPFEAVEIPTLGVTVAKGKSITVSDEVGESLIAQGWTPARKARKGEED